MKQYLIVFLLTSFYVQAMKINNFNKVENKSKKYEIVRGFPHGPYAYKEYLDGRMKAICTAEQLKKAREKINK